MSRNVAALALILTGLPPGLAWADVVPPREPSIVTIAGADARALAASLTVVDTTGAAAQTRFSGQTSIVCTRKAGAEDVCVIQLFPADR